MKDYGMTQEYDKYTEEDNKVWRLLHDRQSKILPGRASQAYMDGVNLIGFTRDDIPRFEDMNAALNNATGWGLVVVPGLIDNKPFFEYLKNSLFPATTWFRKLEEIDYLEEPDMFHDIFGHVPLLANKDFCSFLSGLSEIALRHIDNPWAVEVLSRLYWYTVEFGLIRNEEGKLEIYGAGILSSAGESVYSLDDDTPSRYDFDVERIMRTPYIKDKFQEHYFVIDSYKQLYDSVPEAERVLNILLNEPVPEEFAV